MARRVDLKDQNPLIIKAETLVNGACAVCRCGLSGQWPMCDGTHKATMGEEPDKLYRYERELPQGTIRRFEVGKLEMPGDKVHEEKAADGSAHEGAAAHRPRRPEHGVTSQATKGNEAGTESKDGDAQDELVTGAPGETDVEEPKPLVTGGAESALVGGKNRSGQGGESA